MKKPKIISTLILVLLLSTTAFAVDTAYPGHNSNFNLRYGSGSTSCTDTHLHRYGTFGNANNTHSARLAVYVLDSAGYTKASDSSTGSSTHASAWWSPYIAMGHSHRAGSSIVN